MLALVKNIEGRERHRREVFNKGIKPDHPRASSTDNVKCFFSMMRDSIGSNFNVKQVKYGIRKVYSEFVEPLDLDLPFHYHTAIHVFMRGHYQNLISHQR